MNILPADSGERGRGYGTAAQQLMVDYLLERHDTSDVFAYTYLTNIAGRRALQRAGFEEFGLLPHAHYRVELPPEPCVLYAMQKQSRSP